MSRSFSPAAWATWRRTVHVGVLAMGVAAGLAMPAPATAQDNRAEGFRAGSVIFKPVLALSEGYDSNIFEDAAGGTGSFITTVRPTLSIASDFSRHRVQFDIGMQQDFFHQSSEDNTFTAFAGTDATFDITRQLRLKGSVDYRRRAEQRGSDEVGTNVGGPIYSDQYVSELRVQYLPGDFRIEPFVRAAVRDFMDRGTIVDQDDRDRRTLEGGLELGYRLSPGYEAFVRASYFDTDFLQAVDSAGVNRDSTGFKTLAGVKLKLSRLVTGSVGLGFVLSSFEDPAFQNTTDFTAEIGLDWTPRRRWNIGLNARREIEPTNIAGASDKVESALALQARYEIMRGVGGFVRTGFNRSEFSGINRTDTGYFAGFGVDWAVTRQASLRLAYNYLQEFSTDPAEEFTKHTATLGARYGF